MSTGIRWADSSDESEDEYSTSMAHVTQHTGLNDGSIPAMQQGGQPDGRGGVAGFSSDEEEANEIDEESESESEESESEEDELPRKVDTEPVKKEVQKPPPRKRALSKKEKQALKAKELDALDNLLNEFGVAEDAKPELEKKEEEETKAQSPPADAADAKPAPSKKKKKEKEE